MNFRTAVDSFGTTYLLGRARSQEELNKALKAVGETEGVAKPVEHFPDNIPEKMIDNDFEWAAANRKDILAEWSSRYDVKSEPKS